MPPESDWEPRHGRQAVPRATPRQAPASLPAAGRHAILQSGGRDSAALFGSSMRVPESRYDASWTTRVLTDRNGVLLLSSLFLAVGLVTVRMQLAATAFFLLLSLFVLEMFHRIFVARLRAHRRFHGVAFAGDHVAVRIGVANPLDVPCYNAEVRDRFGISQILQPSILLHPQLAARSITSGDYVGDCGERRGRHVVGPLSVVLRDPFGFCEIEKTFEESAPLNVYPAAFPIEHFPVETRSSRFDVNIRNAPQSGGHDEFRGIREYRKGDSLRWIHWVSSLRHHTLMVKDFELPTARNMTIFLDGNRATSKGLGPHSTMEMSVRIAISLSAYAVAHHHRVSLIAQGARPWIIPPGGGEAQLQILSDAFLDMEQDGDCPFDELLVSSLDLIPIDSCAVLVFPTSLIDVGAYLEAIAVLQSRLINVIAVLVRDDLFFRVFQRNYENEVAFEDAVEQFVGAGVTVYTVDSRENPAEYFRPERARRG
jgi:uncharacterized protein (DUF58 family)